MLHDIQQVQSAPIAQMKLTHLVGLMTFTRDQMTAAFNKDNPAPKKVADQLERFNNAYRSLDGTYKSDTYSLDTERLRQADEDCDRTFMGIKKMVGAQQAFDFNPTVKEAADRMMLAIGKFDINPDEDYLGENSKLQQLLEDVKNIVALKDDAQTLGLAEAFDQLATKVALVRELITRRETGKAPKGAMKAARTQMEPEYRWLIAILNAAALMDDDEHRFDPLITALNANIDYLKKNVLSRKGNIVWDYDDYDDDPDFINKNPEDDETQPKTETGTEEGQG